MAWMHDDNVPAIGYEAWKRESGITDEDERKFLERRAQWRDPGKPEITWHPLRRIRLWLRGGLSD